MKVFVPFLSCVGIFVAACLAAQGDLVSSGGNAGPTPTVASAESANTIHIGAENGIPKFEGQETVSLAPEVTYRLVELPEETSVFAVNPEIPLEPDTETKDTTYYEPVIEESGQEESVEKESSFEDNHNENLEYADSKEEPQNSEQTWTNDDAEKESGFDEKQNDSQESRFEIYFIDVGQGDSALIFCDGEVMLIDGGKGKESDTIYAYLERFSIDRIHYMVATHADEDHIGGLMGALSYPDATVDCVYCPVVYYDTETFRKFSKKLEENGLSITVPTAGESFWLGSAQIQILGPLHTEGVSSNNTSIVLRIVYGETSFLFTGDAEREEEQDLLDAGYALKSTVLKVGHHGSNSSTTYPFLREVLPEYAVISVGKENTYGHPTEDTLSRLRDAEATLYRTDLQGEIHCVSDGHTVTFSVEKNAEIDTYGGIEPNSTQR